MAYFTPKTVDFLVELLLHNNRDWFNENKQKYEDLVREPSFAFIRAIGPEIEQISPFYEAKAKKSGGSLKRIHRDVRFSRNKTPYKTNIGIQIRHQAGKYAPEYYIHIEPDEVFVGVGMWRPARAELTKIREKIVNEAERWNSILEDPLFTDTFSIIGDSLKRAPKGYHVNHPQIVDLRRKDHLARRILPQNAPFEPDFLQETARIFRIASPYMRFLCEAVEVSF